MLTISPATLRRLRQLKQSHGIWEGARCVLPSNRKQRFGNVIPINEEGPEKAECILWVDASMGTVRTMSIVDADSGPESMVRALLQAIERPQSNLPPGRPQKVLVNDRESQFYLRGILQELEIGVEFAEHLPLVHEILASFMDNVESAPDPVPSALAPALYQQALGLWKIAPWEDFADHQVIEIELNQWDVTSLYAIFMGKLGLELGVIFYRTLDSLKQFRFNATRDVEELNLEETFLSQDCMFMLFNAANELSESERQMIHSYGWESKTHYPCFGILHPLEGDRSFLYNEDALAFTAALEGLQLFLHEHRSALQSNDFPTLRSTYTLATVPDAPSITLQTLVEVSDELMSIGEDRDDEEQEPLISIYLIPRGSLIKMTSLPLDFVEKLRNQAVHKGLSQKPLVLQGKFMSVLLIQNSKPKILELIKALEEEEGLVGISFNPAEDFMEEKCSLGLLVTGNARLHLFGEFYPFEPDEEDRKEWKNQCKQNSNKCAIILAMGIRGDSRGKPKMNHILGFYEVDLIPSSTLGLGTLQAFPLLSPEMYD